MFANKIHQFLLALLLVTATPINLLDCATQVSQILDCTNSTNEPTSSSPCTTNEITIGQENNKTIVGQNLETNFAGNAASSSSRRDVSEVCANQIRGKDENGDGTSLICSPSPSSQQQQQQQQLDQRSGPKKPIKVFIRTPNNSTQFDLGSSLTIECRFHVDSSMMSQDFRFKLKWMRSVVGAQSNQSITTTELTDSSLTIIAATTRLWTVQRNGGLDLELQDFQEDDMGNYFCQALASDNGQIISEAQVKLTINKREPSQEKPPTSYLDSTTTTTISNDEDNLQPYGFYSQENLSKLLPSLKVMPQFTELAPGETVQLICSTSHLDPDPDPSTIEWSFEAIANRRQLMHKSPTLSSELPHNISVLGNVLIVWSMSQEHCGIYKCSLTLADFDLTVQASGEVALRPALDSAPLVFVSPEIVRLSPNGSAKIQCEATGYPPPEVVWYRVESIAQTTNQPPISLSDNSKQPQQATKRNDSISGGFGDDSCIEFEQVPYKDAILYCDQNRCLSASHRSSVTGVSLINIKQARAHHQGQWVCRASNKHGSNQASSLVDVEFRERPLVRIVPEIDREQTIVLASSSSGAQDSMATASQLNSRPNATFKCSIESGKPQPKLRWLRTSISATTYGSGSIGSNNNHQLATSFPSNSNLDLYDLTRVSSATSNVSTHFEDYGRSLVLVLGTITLEDEGDYICLGENEWGRHSAVARLMVRQPSSLRILQASPMIAQPNRSFHLDCLATGHPSPVDIEWSRYDRGAFFSLISKGSGPSSHYSMATGGDGQRAMLKFDRVGVEDSGEYTCNARDPLNGTLVLRDTIMVLVGDGAINSSSSSVGQGHTIQQESRAHDSLLPKLMVRPTKITATPGSNVTLDCLAVSGLQPTVVEWIAPSLPPLAMAMDPPGTDGGGTPALMINQTINGNGNGNGGRGCGGLVWSHYRAGTTGCRMVQFGSKLRILNVSKQHEGVYQCRGSNKVGVENAPALIRVLDPMDGGGGNGENGVQLPPSSDHNSSTGSTTSSSSTSTLFVVKTKVARVGSNIELKCQVNGLVEQPATSWSRDGLELPGSSVQIEHNLWIQNVSHKDSGLYICSARSKQPNKVIQARINLLVSGQLMDSSPLRPYNLTAKIVASKSTVSVSDSITLECIVTHATSASANGNQSMAATSIEESMMGSDKELAGLDGGNRSSTRLVELEEIERNVVWTNVNTGQSVFQDNVYVQQNLLIIYELRLENSAIYRCNYDDFTHHVDYRLQVAEAPGEFQAFPSSHRSSNTTNGGDNNSNNNLLMGAYGHHAQIKQVTLGWPLTLECLPNDGIKLIGGTYRWTRGEGSSQRSIGPQSAPLVFESIKTGEADMYRCHYNPPPSSHYNQKQLATNNVGDLSPPPMQFSSFIVQVLVPVARFVQRPVSFVSLPSISGANQQLEMELKFLPERDHGLILFNGQRQWNRSAVGDYISLGLHKGFLEFRFELGDGTTLLRSLQSLALNQWHQVLIERNRRGAVMWLDKQPPVSNSSSGKFFNLNLDTVLYVGGNQYFLTNKSRPAQPAAAAAAANNNGNNTNINNNQTVSGSGSGSNPSRRFYGYSRGFQGCISLLRIGQSEIDLISRTRGASIGIYECDKPECRHNDCGGGICQVDRPIWPGPSLSQSIDSSSTNDTQNRKSSSSSSSLESTSSNLSNGQRCICPPGFVGEHCEIKLSTTSFDIQQQSKNVSAANPAAPAASGESSSTKATKETSATTHSTPANTAGTLDILSQHNNATNISSVLPNFPGTMAGGGGGGGACELLNPCKPNGTQSCQSLTSTSFKCHCRLGFMGDTCLQAVIFSNETSLWFNQQAYLQFRFHRPEEAQLWRQNNNNNDNNNNQDKLASSSIFANLTNFARLTSMAESQSISFKLQTKSSYGLIFYMGQATNSLLPADPSNQSATNTASQQQPISLSLDSPASVAQTSKSMVANLLARLSSIVFDYLAIALVDGHVELSYELGSGVAIIRSSQRVNDGSMHQIRVVRSGRSARLTIDDLHKHEGSSPGKLSMLNTPRDIYLGGLPHLAELTHNMYMSGFVGCVSNLKINSLGPINLIRSDHLTQVRSARNLAPCPAPDGGSGSPVAPHDLPATGGSLISSTTTTSTTTPLSPSSSTLTSGGAGSQQASTTTIKYKPYKAPAQPESDDPDEM